MESVKVVLSCAWREDVIENEANKIKKQITVNKGLPDLMKSIESNLFILIEQLQ